MKRIALLALALAAASTPASADHGSRDFIASGKIMIGTGDLTSGRLPLLDPPRPSGRFTQTCEPGNAREGVDLATIALPAGSDGHALTLKGTNDAVSNDPDIAVADVDAWFLDSECSYIAGTELAQLFDEAGVVPTGAAFVEVDLFNGVDATYILTIEAVLP